MSAFRQRLRAEQAKTVADAERSVRPLQLGSSGQTLPTCRLPGAGAAGESGALLAGVNSRHTPVWKRIKRSWVGYYCSWLSYQLAVCSRVSLVHCNVLIPSIMLLAERMTAFLGMERLLLCCHSFWTPYNNWKQAMEISRNCGCCWSSLSAFKNVIFFPSLSLIFYWTSDRRWETS